MPKKKGKEKNELGSGYLGHLDNKIIGELGRHIHIRGIHEGQFLEVAILEAAFVEFMLRVNIFKKVSKKKELVIDNSARKYWDGQASFSQLVDYYELLGGLKSTVRELRQYNALRNSIVHHLLEYKSIKKLYSDAKTCYKKGIVIESMFRSEIKFPSLQDMSYINKL